MNFVNAARGFGDFCLDQPQRPPSGHGNALRLGRPLQVVQSVERETDRSADHDHAVIGEKQHFLVAQQPAVRSPSAASAMPLKSSS